MFVRWASILKPVATVVESIGAFDVESLTFALELSLANAFVFAYSVLYGVL